MNTKTHMIIGGVIIAVVAFVGGYMSAGGKAVSKGGMVGSNSSQNQIRTGGFNRTGGTMGSALGAGAGARGGIVVGSILSKDDQSIVVKLQDGGSKIVFTSTSTQVAKTVTGNTADLVMGENVMVMGTTNADGSITAQSVTIRPTK